MRTLFTHILKLGNEGHSLEKKRHVSETLVGKT